MVKLIILILALLPVVAIAEDALDTLKKEPASMLDLGMHRLSHTLNDDHQKNKLKFKNDYKSFRYYGDVARYDPVNQIIIITRSLDGSPDINTCTIAIQTLRSQLITHDGRFATHEFLSAHFWHLHNRPASNNLYENLKKQIYLHGLIYSDPVFDCYSRLDDKQVHVGDQGKGQIKWQ